MLNKKAIAAFAAGATLLSGFAFAAPAMAEVTVPDTCPAEKPLKSANAAVTAQAKKDWEDAKKLVPAQPVKPTESTDNDVKGMYENDTAHQGKLKMKAVQANADPAKVAAANAYVISFNKYVDDLAAYTPKKTAADHLYDVYTKALAFETNCSTPDPDPKDGAINTVQDAAKDLQHADNAFAKAKKAYYDAKVKFLKAQAELKARKAAWEAAQAALSDFDVSGVNDSAKEQRLADAVNRTKALFDLATSKCAEAETAKENTEAAAKIAGAAYDVALQVYKAAYDAAIRAGVNPALLPAVKTADPLDLSFNPVPGAAEIYAAAEKGEFGPATQAAAQKGKDAAKSKASAQQNKKNNAADANGASASAAAQLPKSGAAVAMAAVAASVLAGMGAALRKIRH
ncbi:hypothetical protein [Gardnerella vaginalis]|uniref:hypothetical protein n=1 Tax=Gardnerella vaginalis TaxID=2702 RepID=UPI0039EEB8BE